MKQRHHELSFHIRGKIKFIKLGFAILQQGYGQMGLILLLINGMQCREISFLHLWRVLSERMIMF